MPNGLYTWAVLAVVAAAAILIGVAITISRQRRRTEQLQLLFGSEYDRAVRLYGDQDRAERALEGRRRRLQDFGVHELDEAEREQFLREWQLIQASSANDPTSLLIRADSLLTEVMRAEGCPADDSTERKVDLGLMHPSIAEEYRLANDVVERQTLGLTTPEERRGAIGRYTRIFESILGEPEHLRRVA